MDSAPKEKPANVSRTMVISMVFVQALSINTQKKMIKNKVNPRTAKPATPSPITVPPPNDIFSAFGKLVLAAWVVLTLVLVAIFIPMFPAKAEKKAPKIKATTISQCVVGTIKETAAKATLTITTKIARSLYSAFKNAKAPSYI